MNIETILCAEVAGMLIGVLIIMFYNWYRLRLIDKEYEESTALILEWMRVNHEHKMEMMEFMNDLQKTVESEKCTTTRNSLDKQERRIERLENTRNRPGIAPRNILQDKQRVRRKS